MIKSLSHLKHGEFYFPMTDGTNGQVLVTDGSGQLTWATQSTGSNKFLSGLSFNTGTGVLTATVTGSADVTIDLDGRYVQAVRGDGTTISTSTDLDTREVTVSPIFNNTITETGTALVTSGTIWTYINDSILDIAPIQSVGGDGVSISTSTDADTGQVNIGPIVNNEPTQNSGALVKSGGIWSYIDGLAFDEYTSWNLKTNGVQRTSVQSGGTLDLVAGTNVSLSYGAGGKVTIDSTDTNTDTNHYLSGASFSTSNGVLTLTVSGATNQTVDLDGRYEYAGHKYHSFSDGQQFYDSYNQANYLRLFTENTVFDTFRFRSYSDVEFWNGTAWEAWTQSLDVLFDGREETGFNLQHANKRFRFVINRSSGWPTTALFVLQSTWSDTKDHTCDVKIETFDGTNWNEKTRWTYSNFQRGMNVHTTSSLHDGKNKMRVEIDIDWTDLSHDYFPFKSLFLLSNYSGGQTLDPWTWDYSGSVNFQALPKSAGDNLATQTWVGSQGYAAGTHNHDADYVNITGDTMTGDLSIKGNILLTGDPTTTNQSRMIDFTGFDKEGTTDPSDRAYIRHTVNTGGHAGTVLEISSQNDSGDGIAFTTNASSLLKHNGNALFSEGHKPTWSEVEDKPTTFDPSTHDHDGRYLKLNPRLNANGDTVKESGIHIWDVSGASDDPVGASDGILTTKYWDSSDWAVQMFEDFHQRELHIRNKRSGTWQEDWAQVHTTDNFSTTDVANGVTAHGWGNHADGGYLTSYSETSDLESVRARDNSIAGVINFTPDTGDILQVDGQVILKRTTANGGITIGHDDAVIIAGGDTSSTLNSNINNANETVYIGAEGGMQVYAFPDNMSGGWDARKTWTFSNSGDTTFPGKIYPTNQSTDYVNSTRIQNWQTAYGWGDHASAGYGSSSFDGKYSSLSGIPTTFAPSAHNHTSLTGVTNLTFAAQSSDAASITTTIDGTHTYFDFNLTDDNNNDWWRWRFTPSGSTLYDAMVLKPASNGNANLTVSGNVTADNIPTSYAPVDAEKNVQADWNATSGDALILNKPSLAFNTIIGTDSDITTSGATVINDIYMTDGVITSHTTRTLTAANLGISKPAKPVNLSLSVVNDTVNVTFEQAGESNHEYLVFSAVNDSSFGLISVFSPEDFAKNMSVIDDSFTQSGKIHYRVYAVKNGIYSDPLTASIDYTTPTNDVANIYSVSLNTPHFIQWDQPSINSRFVNTYKLYGQSHANQASLSKSNSTLLYDGLNTSFMHAVSKDDNFTQFWVDVIYN